MTCDASMPLLLLLLAPSPRHPSRKLSVMTTMVMSTMSGVEGSREVVETATTTEAPAVRAGTASIAPQHPRQLLQPPTAHNQNRQEYADGTGSSVTKPLSVSPIALVTPPSWPHRIRETAREDADSERGHLLLFIIF